MAITTFVAVFKGNEVIILYFIIIIFSVFFVFTLLRMVFY